LLDEGGKKGREKPLSNPRKVFGEESGTKCRDIVTRKKVPSSIEKKQPSFALEEASRLGLRLEKETTKLIATGNLDRITASKLPLGSKAGLNEAKCSSNRSPNLSGLKRKNHSFKKRQKPTLLF